ncbi:MAG: BamA/TamA family outer membrane protein [bacterium]
MQDRTTNRFLLTLLVASAILYLAPAAAAGQEYEAVAPTGQDEVLFSITFDKEQVTFTVQDDGRSVASTYPRKSLVLREGKALLANGELIMDREGLLMEGIRRMFDDVHNLRIMDEDDRQTVDFLTMDAEPSRLSRVKRGNVFAFAEPVVVEENEFIRGIVLSIAGDVEVYGEVNRDIVTILGDIYVGPAAVARGDIATVRGRIDVASDASIYGEQYSADQRRRVHKRRYSAGRDEVSDQFGINYNRVDGLYIQEGIRYDDDDSLLPSLWTSAGYAFASERWRFELGFEQTILRRLPIAVSGTYYRRLSSEDDWLLSDKENMFLAVLAKEDYKDYYETEGASFGFTSRPVEAARISFGYYQESTRWLSAHRNLWSLFGGDKRFRENFATVDSSWRSSGMDILDSLDNSGLRASFDLNTRGSDGLFDASSWHASADLEWSSPDLDSDFDYRRYTFNLRRYQKLHRQATLILRGVYAGSDGRLPMHKRFFLGGLGSLRGYDHKEYIGTTYWMANAEYRISFPHSDLAASIFCDIGQIANETALDGDVEVKSSLGVGLYLGEDLRINFSRRLDDSLKDNINILVRLEHTF